MPITISNICKRALAGDAPPKLVQRLEAYLDAPEHVWENSWVRFPLSLLNAYARSVLQFDLLADKKQPDGPLRCDVGIFQQTVAGKSYLRIPISYLLKLALGPGHRTVGRADACQADWRNGNVKFFKRQYFS